jgi:CheY-like chemotaxis protein
VPQELAQAWVQFMRDDVSQSVNSMNNRLNAILAAIRDVPAGSLDRGTQAALEQIRTEVARAVQITTRLLRRADSMAPETAPEMLKPLAQPATRPAHILLVEDDPINRLAITRLLEALGHRVAACENGMEAFGAIQTRAVDCIVCDLRMPALGGRSFFEQVEEQYPHLASRFVFVTGDYTNPDSRSFLDHSGQPVVAKPFEVAELVNAVAVILRRVGVLAEASGQKPTSC